MAAKSKPDVKPKPVKYPRKEVPIYIKQDDDDEMQARRYAELMTSPELAAYRVIHAAEHKSGFGDQIDVPTMLAELRSQAAAVNRGDMAKTEAMLMNQATTLQTLFSRLANRAMGHDQIPGFEANMRMALKAQSQCRATLETLATIKNPPVVIARQANIANGPQQVNNGVPAPASPVREEKEIRSTGLLTEDQHGPTLDTRGTAAASGTDSAMATLGEVHRPGD